MLGIPKLRPIVISYVDRLLSSKLWYKDYRRSIHYLINWTMFLGGVSIKTIFIVEIYHRFVEPHRLFIPGISFATPRILGTPYIHNRMPDTPPFNFPQGSKYPFEHLKKTRFVEDIFFEMIEFRDRMYYTEGQWRDREGRTPLDESLGYSPAERKSKEFRAETLRVLRQNTKAGDSAFNEWFNNRPKLEIKAREDSEGDEAKK